MVVSRTQGEKRKPNEGRTVIEKNWSIHENEREAMAKKNWYSNESIWNWQCNLYYILGM